MKRVITICTLVAFLMIGGMSVEAKTTKKKSTRKTTTTSTTTAPSAPIGRKPNEAGPNDKRFEIENGRVVYRNSSNTSTESKKTEKKEDIRNNKRFKINKSVTY